MSQCILIWLKTEENGAKITILRISRKIRVYRKNIITQDGTPKNPKIKLSSGPKNNLKVKTSTIIPFLKP